MPPEMAVSMRHTKLKAEEAALLAGELTKPSWESKNEGIHERVSFEDSIWGFDLAGGSYYKTPLRVTYVKPDSRAAKAGIRPGDKLKRINDIDTSTLTIQEAHEIIIQSGIHLKLAVTAPEDEADAYYCYEDPIDEDGYDSEEERRKEEEKARKRQVHARVSHYWSLQWPWVSKRRIIYRESNCFMVPSKFEDKHRDQFPPQPVLKESDDFVLDSLSRSKLTAAAEQTDNKTEYERLMEKTKKVENFFNGKTETSLNNGPVSSNPNKIEPPKDHAREQVNGTSSDKEIATVNGKVNEVVTTNGHLGDIAESEEEQSSEITDLDESVQEISEAASENIEDHSLQSVVEESSLVNGNRSPKDEAVIDELLNDHDDSILEEEEEIIDSILNENDR